MENVINHMDFELVSTQERLQKAAIGSPQKKKYINDISSQTKCGFTNNNGNDFNRNQRRLLSTMQIQHPPRVIASMWGSPIADL